MAFCRTTLPHNLHDRFVNGVAVVDKRTSNCIICRMDCAPPPPPRTVSKRKKMTSNNDCAPRRIVSREKQRSFTKSIRNKPQKTVVVPAALEEAEFVAPEPKKASSSRRAAAAKAFDSTMQAAFCDQPTDLHGGDADLRRGAECLRSAIEYYNQNEFDPCCNSYDYVPAQSASDDESAVKIDWRKDDVQITDNMFVPTRLSQVVDNQRSIATLSKWLDLWTAKPLILPKRCVAFVRGAPGIGKTTAVRLALQEHGFNNIVEINASSERSQQMIQERLKPLIMHSSVSGGLLRTAIVLEEVDGLYFGNSGGSGRPMRSRRSSGGAGGGLGSTSAIGSSGGSSSGADALVKFFQSSGYRPSGCDKRGLSPETAPAAANETWQRFRSTVPIIMVANESYAPFMSSLSDVSLVLRFFKLHDKQVLFRIVNQLSVALNVRWSAPSTEGYFKGVPLYKVLVAHAAGDLRKATALMTDAMRAAYSRRKKERADAAAGGYELSAAKHTDYLVIRRVDCQAFFGSSKEDVMDSVPTLFGSTRFVLCQMRCKCAPGTCSCTSNEPPPQPSSNNAKSRTTVWSQVQRMATHDIRAMPDMLFENAYLFSAEPQRSDDVECRLAASKVRRLMAANFSNAESLRSDFIYLTDRSVQEFYMQFGMVAPALLARYPHKYAHLPPDTVSRPACIDRTGIGAQINLQKSSLAGEEGNAALTLSRSKQERNAYAAHFRLPYQISLERWYRTDNFVSKIDETRSQTQMLFQDKKKLAAKAKEEGGMEVVKSNQKMSKKERDALRQEIKQLEQEQKRSEPLSQRASKRKLDDLKEEEAQSAVYKTASATADAENCQTASTRQTASFSASVAAAASVAEVDLRSECAVQTVERAEKERDESSVGNKVLSTYPVRRKIRRVL